MGDLIVFEDRDKISCVLFVQGVVLGDDQGAAGAFGEGGQGFGGGIGGIADGGDDGRGGAGEEGADQGSAKT